MMDNSITTVKRNIFAVTDADRRAAQAMKMMLPNGKLLTDDNALALLLYGKLHGLDPLNQECFYLVSETKDKQTGEIIRKEGGCAPGIKGKRRKAKDQSFYRTEFEDYDPALLGLQPADVAKCMKCELRADKDMGEYIMQTFNLSKAGYDKQEIEKIVGKPPVFVGYGVVMKNEVWRLKTSPKVLAMKRAESGAINQRFDLPFADTAEDMDASLATPDIDSGPTIAVSQAVIDYSEDIPDLPEVMQPKKTEAELVRALGFDEKKEVVDAEIVQPTLFPVKQPAPPDAWEKYYTLAVQAEELKIPVEPPAEDCTVDELRQAYKALDAKIKSALS